MANDDNPRAYRDEGLPGDKFGTVETEKSPHSHRVSGTRKPGWMVQPIAQDVRISSTTYEEIDANIGYGVLPFPPGHVPLLRVVCHLDADPKSTCSLRISIVNGRTAEFNSDGELVATDKDPRTTLLEVTGEGETQVFDEVYLSEIRDTVAGLPNEAEAPTNTFILEAKKEDESTDAKITRETTVSYELEAL